MQNNSHYIAALIKRQWIRNDYVATDLFTIDVLDEDFVGGYKPMIFTMESLREILIDSISFIDLPDSPDTYAGFSGQVPVVNPEENGLMFVDYVDTFLDLLDTPADYTGMEGYGVFVNGTADGLEFVAPAVIPAPYVPTPSYEARVQFDGVNQPAVNSLLANDLGVNVVWTRTGVGVFFATFSAPVDDTKLTAYIGGTGLGTFTIGQFTSTYIQFIHYAVSGGPSDPTGDIPIEIKLYP